MPYIISTSNYRLGTSVKNWITIHNTRPSAQQASMLRVFKRFQMLLNNCALCLASKWKLTIPFRYDQKILYQFSNKKTSCFLVYFGHILVLLWMWLQWNMWHQSTTARNGICRPGGNLKKCWHISCAGLEYDVLFALRATASCLRWTPSNGLLWDNNVAHFSWKQKASPI